MTTDNELPDPGILTLDASPELPTELEPDPIMDEAPKADPQKDAMHHPQSRTFAGQRLHPFDWRRQEAADALGLKFFKLHGEVAAEFEETERYDGIAGDAAIVVWLCSISPSNVAKAIRLPGQATEHRLKWAEKNIGGIGHEAHGQMMNIYGEILGDFMASLSEPKKKPGKPSEE